MASQEAARLEAALNEKAAANVESFAASIEGFGAATAELKTAAETLRGGGNEGLQAVASEILGIIKEMVKNPV